MKRRKRITVDFCNKYQFGKKWVGFEDADPHIRVVVYDKIRENKYKIVDIMTRDTKEIPKLVDEYFNVLIKF